jgi:hypothetical protein
MSRLRLFGPILRYVFGDFVLLNLYFVEFKIMLEKKNLSEIIPEENEGVKECSIKHKFYLIVGDICDFYHLKFASFYVEKCVCLNFVKDTIDHALDTLIDCNYEKNWGLMGRVFKQLCTLLFKKGLEIMGLKYNYNGKRNERVGKFFKFPYLDSIYISEKFKKLGCDFNVLYIEDSEFNNPVFDAYSIHSKNKFESKIITIIIILKIIIIIILIIIIIIAATIVKLRKMISFCAFISILLHLLMIE